MYSASAIADGSRIVRDMAMAFNVLAIMYSKQVGGVMTNSSVQVLKLERKQHVQLLRNQFMIQQKKVHIRKKTQTKIITVHGLARATETMMADTASIYQLTSCQ